MKGTIEKTENGKFIVNGIVNKIGDDQIEITELPIGVWTQNYKEQIEKWMTTTDTSPAIVKVASSAL